MEGRAVAGATLGIVRLHSCLFDGLRWAPRISLIVAVLSFLAQLLFYFETFILNNAVLARASRCFFATTQSYVRAEPWPFRESNPTKVGMGRIGAAVAKRATGFGMKILYYNRSRNIAGEQEVQCITF